MIEVVYDGNLGNNLFQYCFGRLLAEQLIYQLKAAPIAGFECTGQHVAGRNFEGGRRLVLRGQKPDLSFLAEADPRYHIILTGYFQRAEYYQAHRRKIKDWLRLDQQNSDGVDTNDVVVGIRRGKDYIPQHGLPLSYYEVALAKVRFRRVHICTNAPRDPFVRYLAKKYSATVRNPDALDNLAFITRFKKIIISNSTFLWWAAFLSEANQVIAPRPKTGFWARTDPISKNIDLEMQDDRYHYVEAAHYKPEFLGESIDQWHRELKNRLKAGVRRLLPPLRRDPPPPGPFVEH